MDCRQARQLYSLWLDGVLPSREAAALHSHLSGCGACLRELEDWETLRLLVQELGVTTVSAPPGFAAAVMERVRCLPVVTPGGARGRLAGVPWRQAAAGLAAAALLALGWNAVTPGPSQPPLELAEHRAQEVSPSKAPAGASETEDIASPTSPATADPGAAGTDSAPRTTTPANSGTAPTAVKVAEAPLSPVAFLSKERIIRSTMLRLEVDNLSRAQAEAENLGSRFGAEAEVAVRQEQGEQGYVILRFVVDEDDAATFIQSAAGQGRELDRQEDAVDVTGRFAAAVEQYEQLVAQLNGPLSLQEKEGMRRDIAALEQQLTQWDSEAGRHVVILWLQRP